MPRQMILHTSLTFIVSFFLLVLSTGCVELKTAYIPPDTLPNGWIEATSLYNTGIEFLGLEKWSSVTYELNGDIDASLTVTTINTLVLTDETDLISYVNSTVHFIFQGRTTLKELWRGTRDLSTGHTSKYVIYQGINSSTNKSVRLIGEVWNCGVAGISIICLGFVFNDENSTTLLEDSSAWAVLVGDLRGTIDGHISDVGLIFKVQCH